MLGFVLLSPNLVLTVRALTGNALTRTRIIYILHSYLLY